MGDSDREVFLREGTECWGYRSLSLPSHLLDAVFPRSDAKGYPPPKEEFYPQLSEPLFLSLAGEVRMDNLLY